MLYAFSFYLTVCIVRVPAVACPSLFCFSFKKKKNLLQKFNSLTARCFLSLFTVPRHHSNARVVSVLAWCAGTCGTVSAYVEEQEPPSSNLQILWLRSSVSLWGTNLLLLSQSWAPAHRAFLQDSLCFWTEFSLDLNHQKGIPWNLIRFKKSKKSFKNICRFTK